jgi:hypothetical protein
MTGAVGLVFVLSLTLPLANVGAADLKTRVAASQLGFKSSGGSTLSNFHCGPGEADTCDADFAAKCKDKGGTLSREQGWGGKTCWTPGGWEERRWTRSAEPDGVATVRFDILQQIGYQLNL